MLIVILSGCTDQTSDIKDIEPNSNIEKSLSGERNNKKFPEFVKIYKLTDNYAIGFSEVSYFKEHNPDTVFRLPFVISNNDTIQINGFECYSSLSFQTSPNGNYTMTDATCLGYMERENEETVLHDVNHCFIINLKKAEIVKDLLGVEASGEWNEMNEWIDPITKEIIFK